MLMFAPDYLYVFPGSVLLVTGTVLQLVLLRGATNVGGFYVGIHWLALGSLLSLLGVQVLFLGVFAKAIASYFSFETKGAVFTKFMTWFTLEIGIMVGSVLCFLGVASLAAILTVWLTRNMGHLGSSHTAFVAATMIVIGVQTIFSSFLLSFFVTSQKSGPNCFACSHEQEHPADDGLGGDR